jgi:hypothetical protein
LSRFLKQKHAPKPSCSNYIGRYRPSGSLHPTFDCTRLGGSHSNGCNLLHPFPTLADGSFPGFSLVLYLFLDFKRQKRKQIKE